MQKLPKFLGGKSRKQKEKAKEEDALRRQHLTNQEYVPVVAVGGQDEPSTLEDYYKAKQEARVGGSVQPTGMNASISNDRFVSNY